MGMNINAATAFFALGLLAATSAMASDGSQTNENLLIKTGFKADNALTVRQSTDGGHSASINIGQEDTLLLEDTWMRPTRSALTPGLIVQTGDRHILTLSVSGQGNQLAVQQSGTSNTASLVTTGAANIASVAQSGFGNNAAATQSGQRNSVAILQR